MNKINKNQINKSNKYRYTNTDLVLMQWVNY